MRSAKPGNHLKAYPPAVTASIAQLDLKPPKTPLTPDSVYLTYQFMPISCLCLLNLYELVNVQIYSGIQPIFLGTTFKTSKE